VAVLHDVDWNIDLYLHFKDHLFRFNHFADGCTWLKTLFQSYISIENLFCMYISKYLDVSK
jgi:hypothetical protein